MPTPRRLSLYCLPIFFLSLLAAPAFAGAPFVPKADVYFGYSRLGANVFYPNVGGLNGWEGALNVKVKRFVGIEGDVAQYGFGANSSVPRTTLVLFGPRITAGAAGVHVFVHGLVGGEHSSNSGNISGGAVAVGFGGGADVRFAPFFALRGGADYLSAPGQSTANATRMRFSTGVVFRF